MRHTTRRSSCRPALAATLSLVTLLLLSHSPSITAVAVLYPSLSFNASIASQYSCESTDASLTPTVCAGHGTCYILLDSLRHAPLANTSTSPPITPSDASLDWYDIQLDDVGVVQPYAICVCDSGWTGHGDYIIHRSVDADNCAINSSVILVGLIILSVEMLMMLALSCYRLAQWWQWHDSGMAARKAGGQGHNHDSQLEYTANGSPKLKEQPQPAGQQQGNGIATPLRLSVPTLSHNTPPPLMKTLTQMSTVTVQQQTGDVLGGTRVVISPARAPRTLRAASQDNIPQHATANTPASPNLPPTPTTPTTTYQNSSSRAQPPPKPLNGTNPVAKAISTATSIRRRYIPSAVWRSMQQLSFLYPLTCLGMSFVGVVHCCLRLFTTHTVGPSLLFNIIQLLYQWVFELALCLSAYFMLKLSTKVTRNVTASRNTLQSVRRQFTVALIVSPLAWAAMIGPYYSFPQYQQTSMAIFLVAGISVFFLIGGVYVYHALSIHRELMTNIDAIPERQQKLRRAVDRKLRMAGYGVLLLMSGDLPMLLLIGCWPLLRQYSPYMWLINHYAVWSAAMLQLVISKQSAQPPAKTSAAVAAAVAAVVGGKNVNRVHPMGGAKVLAKRDSDSVDQSVSSVE